MATSSSARDLVADVYREHYGKVLARLMRYLGDLHRAEDALQDAFARAMEVWPERGLPDQPAGWLVTTARNRAIDRLRRDSNFADKRTELEQWTALLTTGPAAADDAVASEEGDIPDDRLRLIFTACHPALAPDARVALTLRTLCGLSTREIARAFLVPEATMAQRLVRAKKKIRVAGIPYELPTAERLPGRLDAALAVVYLVFNEGYTASEGDSIIRQELSNEAIRLGRILCTLMPTESEVLGLTALMLLHDARRAARTSAAGDLVLLEEQDRTLWNRVQIDKGLRLLDRAMRRSRPGPYQIQAAIAALHARAARPEQTDWEQIVQLYESLLRLTASPVVELNLAAALAMARGPSAGLERLDRIGRGGELAGYHLFHAARADLLRRANRGAEALPAYDEAIALTTNRREKVYLEHRRREVRAPRGRTTEIPCTRR